MLKSLIIIPAIVIMSQGVFADEHGVPQSNNQPQPQYQDDGSGYGYGGGGGGCGGGCGGQYAPPPVYQDPCGACYVPPPLPPPIIYNPGINYYCGYAPCVQPLVPYGPPPVAYYPRPYPRPYGRQYFGRPGFGYGFGGGGRPIIAPRRMSASGCEVQQGNNGEFSVISAEGNLLYSSDIQHAQENADYMKSYYEKTSDQCGGVRSPSKSLDI